MSDMIDNNHPLSPFDEDQASEVICRVWHGERWFFSVIDVVGLLTDAPKPRNYWAMMKQRIHDEGFREVLTKCEQLKMEAPDGKQRLTDAADAETLFRIIQSIPSPKAEPFKQWLAKVGRERLDREIARRKPLGCSLGGKAGFLCGVSPCMSYTNVIYSLYETDDHHSP